jgi:hypothetical protein
MPTTTPNGIVIAHDDHDLQPEHLVFIDEALADWDGSFLIRVLPLPDSLASIPSALYGPTAGDDTIDESTVTYQKRNGRRGPSRLIDAPTRPARNLVVIGMQVESGTMMLFTAYGTQSDTASPREWWDLPPLDVANLTPYQALQVLTKWRQDAEHSALFWTSHALATTPEDTDGT